MPEYLIRTLVVKPEGEYVDGETFTLAPEETVINAEWDGDASRVYLVILLPV